MSKYNGRPSETQPRVTRNTLRTVLEFILLVVVSAAIGAGAILIPLAVMG